MERSTQSGENWSHYEERSSLSRIHIGTGKYYHSNECSSNAKETARNNTHTSGKTAIRIMLIKETNQHLNYLTATFSLIYIYYNKIIY